MDDAFSRGMAALHGDGVPDDALSRPFLTLLPLAGASVATVGPFLGNETVSMTDDIAARIDELQFDLGEGPCWDAVSANAAVIEEHIPERSAGMWPRFSAALEQEHVRSIFAFPITFGPFRLGAVDLYGSRPYAFTDELLQQTQVMATMLGRRVLQRGLDRADGDSPVSRGLASRRVVHQATGVVLAQLDITPEDAHLLVRGHAHATGRPIREIAEHIVAREVRFLRDGNIAARDASEDERS